MKRRWRHCGREKKEIEVVTLFCVFFLSVRALLALKFCDLDGYAQSGSK